MAINSLTEALLEFNKHIAPKDLFVTLVPEAQELVLSDPFAFLTASVIDRGTKAEIIWTIPYYLRLQMGHLDASKINQMTEDDLKQIFQRIPYRPRYMHDAPRTIKEMTALVMNKFKGQAQLLWVDQSAKSIKRTLLQIHGVGEGIANMTILLIERAFGTHFDDMERRNLDIKPDVHTKRVLYRLGVSKDTSNSSTLEAASQLNPSFPGEIDGPLWLIGRRFCFPSNPVCVDCPVREYCERKIDDK